MKVVLEIVVTLTEPGLELSVQDVAPVSSFDGRPIADFYTEKLRRQMSVGSDIRKVSSHEGGAVPLKQLRSRIGVFLTVRHVQLNFLLAAKLLESFPCAAFRVLLHERVARRSNPASSTVTVTNTVAGITALAPGSVTLPLLPEALQPSASNELPWNPRPHCRGTHHPRERV